MRTQTRGTSYDPAAIGHCSYDVLEHSHADERAGSLCVDGVVTYEEMRCAFGTSGVALISSRVS